MVNLWPVSVCYKHFISVSFDGILTYPFSLVNKVWQFTVQEFGLYWSNFRSLISYSNITGQEFFQSNLETMARGIHSLTFYYFLNGTSVICLWLIANIYLWLIVSFQAWNSFIIHWIMLQMSKRGYRRKHSPIGWIHTWSRYEVFPGLLVLSRRWTAGCY